MIEHGKSLGLSERVLDATALRAKVIMHNIANQNTPGFKRYSVSFEEQLREATEAGEDPTTVYPVVRRDKSGAPGENNVSVQQELAQLEKVALIHEMFTRRVGGYFAKLKKAIRGHG